MSLIEKARAIAEKFLVIEFRVLGDSTYAKNVRKLFGDEKMFFEQSENFPRYFENENKTLRLYIQARLTAEEAKVWSTEYNHAVIQVVDGFGEEQSDYFLVGTILHQYIIGKEKFKSLLH